MAVQDLISLEGKTTIITGASQGIGEAIARLYHEAGSNVIIVDLAEDASTRIAEDLNAQRPDSAVAYGADVTDAERAAGIVTETIEKFGKVDVLVANAGVFPMKELAATAGDDLRRVYDINVVGVHNYLQPVANHMRELGNGGRIVITLSIDSFHPSAVGLGSYDASKHALYGYMRSAALEYAPDNILINGFAPGGILTPGVTGGADTTELIENASAPLGRWGQSEDMARVALFLGTELNTYATGSAFVSDGGTLLQ